MIFFITNCRIFFIFSYLYFRERCALWNIMLCEYVTFFVSSTFCRVEWYVKEICEKHRPLTYFHDTDSDFRIRNRVPSMSLHIVKLLG
jgi:hypothetical protein